MRGWQELRKVLIEGDFHEAMRNSAEKCRFRLEISDFHLLQENISYMLNVTSVLNIRNSLVLTQASVQGRGCQGGLFLFSHFFSWEPNTSPRQSSRNVT